MKLIRSLYCDGQGATSTAWLRKRVAATAGSHRGLSCLLDSYHVPVETCGAGVTFFERQKEWSGCDFPSLGNDGIDPRSEEHCCGYSGGKV